MLEMLYIWALNAVQVPVLPIGFCRRAELSKYVARINKNQHG
jgi:hypothetical protein